MVEWDKVILKSVPNLSQIFKKTSQTNPNFFYIYPKLFSLETSMTGLRKTHPIVIPRKIVLSFVCIIKIKKEKK